MNFSFRRTSACACLTLASAVLLTGCETVESTDVKTSGIYADFRVTDASSSEVKVYAELRVGGANSNTYLDTKDTGDKLEATVLGVTRTLNRDTNLAGQVKYENYLPDGPEGTQVKVSFTRDSETSAPNSVVTLPASLTSASATSSSGTFPASRTMDGVTISWEPSGSTDSLAVAISGNCINSHTTDVTGDPGSLYLPAGTLVSSETIPSACSIDVSITRKRSGSVDSAFGKGGKITATRETTTSFVSNP